MALTDLLVYLDQTEISLVSLRLAADLAIRRGSRLTALYARERSRAQFDRRKSAELGLVSAQGLQNLDRHIEASIDAMAERLRAALDELTRGHGVEAELRSIDGVAAEVVPQYARYADLCIVGRNELEGSSSVSYTFSEQLLFVTGRPVTRPGDALRASLPNEKLVVKIEAVIAEPPTYGYWWVHASLMRRAHMIVCS
jgi:nucleotide-binding universal stress UspA family protein